MLQISRSRYYAWLKNLISYKAQSDILLIQKIRDIFLEGRMLYGARKIKNRLQQNNIITSRKRITRLMLSADLERKFKATTDSKHNVDSLPPEGGSSSLRLEAD
jgi:hypothetical protein